MLFHLIAYKRCTDLNLYVPNKVLEEYIKLIFHFISKYLYGIEPILFIFLIRYLSWYRADIFYFLKDI